MTTSPDKDTSAFAPTDQAAKPLQRWRVTPQVNQVLEAAFALSTYPNREQRLHLAYTLRATERNIQVWFQNRRQREKKGVGQGAPLNPFAHKLVTKRPLLDSHGKIEQGVVEPNRSNASPPPKRPEFEQRRAVSYDTAFLPTMRSSSHMNLFLDGEPQESTVNSAHDRPFAGIRGPA